MNRSPLLLALLFCAPAAWSHGKSCSVSSDYDLRITDQALLFEEDDGERSIRLADGSVSVDGRVLDLSRADEARVRRFEAGVRELVPEVKAIAIDAVHLASDALKAVSAGLSTDADTIERVSARADQISAELTAQIRSANSSHDFREHEFEDAVEDLIGELVPELVGSITSLAVKAALSGDTSAVEAIERRANELERTIEREVEQRAELIEDRADALCERVRALDEIESSFDFRLPDGSVLDLLDAPRSERRTIVAID